MEGAEFQHVSVMPKETVEGLLSTTAGVYALRSDSNEDTYGRLYDSDMNLINSDDDGGNDVNFRIVNELSAGETYYYGASYLNNSDTGEFSVYPDTGIHIYAFKVQGNITSGGLIL